MYYGEFSLAPNERKAIIKINREQILVRAQGFHYFPIAMIFFQARYRRSRNEPREENK